MLTSIGENENFDIVIFSTVVALLRVNPNTNESKTKLPYIYSDLIVGLNLSSK